MNHMLVDEMDRLPSPQDFVKQFGIDPDKVRASMQAGVRPVEPRVELTPQQKQLAAMSEEFKMLIVHYCATSTNAIQLSEITWGALAARLGTRPEFLQESAEAMNADSELWQHVLHERIRRVSASKIFRDIGWEKLESGTINKLLKLIDSNAIRDPGELLAIATTARRSIAAPTPQPQGGPNVAFNVNFNNGESELPAAGAKMSIDLSPRAASSLQRADERRKIVQGERVIDSQMITADELRNLLSERTSVPLEESANEATEPKQEMNP